MQVQSGTQKNTMSSAGADMTDYYGGTAPPGVSFDGRWQPAKKRRRLEQADQ